jgi:hypothetical protein
MSIAILKRKSATLNAKQSGRPPAGLWGKTGIYAAEGFSLNGGTRSVSVGGVVGVSAASTPYRGAHPVGHGGRRGRYARPQPVHATGPATVQVGGSQHRYVKPSSVSTHGQLRGQYAWIHSGQYPNYWVQPIYPNGTLHENKSQGMHIRKQSVVAGSAVPPQGVDRLSVSEGQHIRQVQAPCVSAPPPFPGPANNTSCAILESRAPAVESESA